MSVGVAVGRWVVAQPVALDIDEVEDVHRGGPDGVGVLRLGGRRERGVQALDRRSVLVEAGKELGPGEERRPARARWSGGGRCRWRGSRCVAVADGRALGVVPGVTVATGLAADGVGSRTEAPVGLPRPNVATSKATATTAMTAPAMSQRDWGMSP